MREKLENIILLLKSFSCPPKTDYVLITDNEITGFAKLVEVVATNVSLNTRLAIHKLAIAINRSSRNFCQFNF